MEMKLQDAELRVMDVLWQAGQATASEIAAALKARYQYSKTTTYTLIKRCVDKGAIQRIDPGFHCRALVSRQAVQRLETKELIDKLYGGTADQLVASLLGDGGLSPSEVQRLKQMIREWGDEE